MIRRSGSLWRTKDRIVPPERARLLPLRLAMRSGIVLDRPFAPANSDDVAEPNGFSIAMSKPLKLNSGGLLDCSSMSLT